MRVAHHLALQFLPSYSSKFSRKDFTLPQLFACLVLREQQRKTLRQTEHLLRDALCWCRDIGMRKAPDHNTLWRAFHALNIGRRAAKLLDVLAQWLAVARQLGDTVAIDSTHYDTHHVSRHYERRLRHHAAGRGKQADSRRSGSARRTPKLSFAVDTRSHLITAARARLGMGSDCPEFEPLLLDAWRRVPGKRLKNVLADAGFDSESNHRIARQDMGIRSLIKPGIGRRGKVTNGRYRRLMRRQLAGPQKGRPYGQRAQAETGASMLKRNLGDCLRARSPRARRHELLLKVLTHNVMILKRRVETEPLRPVQCGT